jgi:hypothetical protein
VEVFRRLVLLLLFALLLRGRASDRSDSLTNVLSGSRFCVFGAREALAEPKREIDTPCPPISPLSSLRLEGWEEEKEEDEDEEEDEG